MEMTGVLYLRYSSSGQKEESIEGQYDYCIKWAEKQNIRIIETYADRAISGTTDHRKEFQRMISESSKIKYDYVIVWKMDRFSRTDRYETSYYKYLLHNNGKKVLSATESEGINHESAAGDIYEAMLEIMAHNFIKNLRDNVKRGNKSNYKKGLYTGGTLPYGYCAKNLKVYRNEKEAEILKIVFERYAAGYTIKSIIDYLNNKGYRNRKGKPFTQNSFQNSLSNGKYTGKWSYEGNVYTDIYPQIIDDSIFLQVQKRLIANKQKQRTHINENFLLARKAFCGHCNSRMVGDSGTSKTGVVYYYYSCGKKKRDRKQCDKKTEQKEALERTVVEKTIKHILQPEKIKVISRLLLEYQDRKLDNSKLKNMEKDIKSIEQRIDKYVSQMLDEPNTLIRDKMRYKIEELSAQQEALKIELNDLKVIEKAKLTEEDIYEFFSSYRNGDIDDPIYQDFIITHFLNAVYIYDDKLVCYYNTPGSSENPVDATTHKRIDGKAVLDRSSNTLPDGVPTKP